MTQTDSGKLVSLISADLFQVERGLSFLPMVIASPFINIVAYALLGITIGYYYTLMVFVLWIILIYLQYLASEHSKFLQGK
jgi:hypothetical protein